MNEIQKALVYNVKVLSEKRNRNNTRNINFNDTRRKFMNYYYCSESLL